MLETAQNPHGAIGPWEQLGRENFAARFLILEEQRLRGQRIAGIEDQAVAFEAEHRGQGQPARREDRPRAQGDHHGVAFDGLAALQHDAAHFVVRATHEARDRAVSQLGAPRLGRAHQARGEGARLHQRRRLRRAELACELHSIRQPRALGGPPRTPLLSGGPA